jgi:hypothetical protein
MRSLIVRLQLTSVLRCDYIAAMAEAGELTMNTVAATASLVQNASVLLSRPRVAQLADRDGIGWRLTEVFHRARASALRRRD